MIDSDRAVHGFAELTLFAAVAPCRACSRRGLVIGDVRVEQDAAGNSFVADASCAQCGEETSLEIRVRPCDPAHLRPAAVRRIPMIINPTGEVSEWIDAAQWLTLYRMAMEAAAAQPERRLSRAVLIEAGQCLAEALRFYPADSDIPPKSAFFTAETLERFREHPHVFARQRLVELAAALPTSTVDPPVPVLSNRPAGTKWWLR